MFERQSTPVNPPVPHSREAEEAVIGSILINPMIYWEVSQILKTVDFYIHRHAWIFEAFGDLARVGMDIDLITVSDALNKKSQLDEIGGSAFLTALLSQVPSSVNATSYAMIVKDCSERRKGIQYANELASASYSGETFSLKEHADRMLKAEGLISNRADAKQAASEAIDMILQKPDYCKFGIPNFDRSIGGLFKAELSIWAGYQGTGKSAAQIHSARVNAEDNKRVLDISLEMTKSQKWMRMACGDLQVDMNKVRSGNVTPEVRARVVRRMSELGELYQDKIVIYQSPMSLMDILAAVIVEQPDIVYIDHLGLIDGKPKGMGLVDWYKQCTRFLRQNVAQGQGHYCHVALLHQLSRGASREKREPTKHDLAYAGEDDADGIYILHREDEAVVTMDGFTDVKLKAEKSRFGWTGYEMVRFKLNQQRFYSTIGEQEPQSWMYRADIGDD